MIDRSIPQVSSENFNETKREMKPARHGATSFSDSRRVALKRARMWPASSPLARDTLSSTFVATIVTGHVHVRVHARTRHSRSRSRSRSVGPRSSTAKTHTPSQLRSNTLRATFSSWLHPDGLFSPRNRPIRDRGNSPGSTSIVPPLLLPCSDLMAGQISSHRGVV